MTTEKKNLGQKILFFPLTKIIIGILVVAVVTGIIQMLCEKLLRQTDLPFDIIRWTCALIACVAAIMLYRILFRWYEKRKITELSTHRIFFQIGFGCLLGFVLQTLTILTIWFFASYEIISINPLSYLIYPFIMSVTAAIMEELIVRGIIFRVLEESLGTYCALVLSALIFGALHLCNPNSSVTAGLGLALQAGLFLAAAYVYTRNLWFPIAIHFAWNFTQGGIYGASVSGNSISHALFSSTIEGDTWVTGGAFGPEGSIQATVYCVIATIFILMAAKRKDQIRPFGLKNKKVPLYEQDLQSKSL